MNSKHKSMKTMKPNQCFSLLQYIKPRERPTHWLDNYVQNTAEGFSLNSCLQYVLKTLNEYYMRNHCLKNKNQTINKVLDFVECKP